MKLPISWLTDYLEFVPEPAELAERLTLAGLEVESVRTADERLTENLVIARIESMQRHPNADRLSLCRVNDGAGARAVVCGATNMEAGDIVVLAKPGAVLPGGLKIKKSKIRGEDSHGMLCSAAELGVAEDHAGILILGADARVGEPAAPLLGLDDCILEIAITPNRGDCLSIYGLAREISVVCGVPQRPLFLERTARPHGAARFRIEVEADDACALYRGIEVHGLTIKASPDWVVKRLAACGMRPINNVVDVTNLVMLDRGQPLHAFDADRLVGTTVGVRCVESNLEVETLDLQARMLCSGDLAIWDGQGPIAIAGVMGGARTAVRDDTRNVFLESALFRPGSVRTTSRRLGLVSESSYRFERGVDPSMVEEALLRASHLLAELGGGSVSGGVAEGGPGVAARPEIVLRSARVERILGTAIGREEITSTLRGLGAVVEGDGRSLRVVPPTHRSDLEREVDLIEEVARLHGYDALPESVPLRPMSALAVPHGAAPLLPRIRVVLASRGLTETVGLAFASSRENQTFVGLHQEGSRPVRLRNPLRAEANEMRMSLLPGLVAAHRVNQRNGVEITDLFTVGRSFCDPYGVQPTGSPHGPVAGEIEAVAGLMWGPRRGRSPASVGPATFWDAKAIVEGVLAVAGVFRGVDWKPCTDRRDYHPRASALVTVDGKPVGYVGQIHPEVAEELEIPFEISMFEVDSRKLLDYAPARQALRAIPRYPASTRDVSLLVPQDLLASSVMAAVDGLREPLVEDVRVFDEYCGEGVPAGRRALAFSIVYRAEDRTLTDDEVADLHTRVVEHVVSTLGVTVRT